MNEEQPCAAQAPLARDLSSEALLEELARRGGHPAILARAALLAARKSQDYDKGSKGYSNMHQVDRSGYFPFGLSSYAQMIHIKSQRFQALTLAALHGEAANFEGLADTALDLINYAAFYAVYAAEQEGGDHA